MSRMINISFREKGSTKDIHIIRVPVENVLEMYRNGLVNKLKNAVKRWQRDLDLVESQVWIAAIKDEFLFYDKEREIIDKALTGKLTVSADIYEA